MLSRRFVLLAGVLVTLNLALWFAAPGLALRQAIVHQLFGQKMVRAVVLEKNGTDWHVDRGVITDVNSSQVTLKEADGRIQPVPLTSSTKVTRLATGRHLSVSALVPRWRVVVTWPDGGAAVSVDVERISHGHGKGRRGHSGAPARRLS